MDKWKKILWKVLFPHTLIIFVLFNVSVVLLLYAFLGKDCPEVIAYISYFVSAYGLTVVCARVPGIVKKVKKGLYRNKYTNLLLTDKELRIRISLYGGLGINICFALFKVVMGVLYQSAWLFAMAGYNTILSGMRFILVYRDQNERKEESDYEKRLRGLHSYKICGWLMLLLNSAISAIVIMVVFHEKKIVYPGYMIYVIALYTFYCLTMAIISMVKYWQRHNPVFSAVKRIGMAKALVSTFTMQAAMLTQFGEGNSLESKMANGATGIGVCLIITTMAVFMLTGVKKDYMYLQKEGK